MFGTCKELVANVTNKINSFFDISLYSVLNGNHDVLTPMLSSWDEVAWLERDGGYEEGIIKRGNVTGLNLENRKTHTYLVSSFLDYFNEKQIQIKWIGEQVLVKFSEGSNYSQPFVNPIFKDSVCLVYVLTNSHSGGVINFLNKGLSQPMDKGNLFIFPALEEYAFSIEGVSSGEMVAAISYIEK